MTETLLAEMGLLLVRAHYALTDLIEAPIGVHITCEDHPDGNCEVIHTATKLHEDIKNFVHEHKLES